MFLNIAKMPLKNFKFMAAFRNLFNKSALSVTYIEHYVQQFNSIKTLSSTYTEETTRRDIILPMVTIINFLKYKMCECAVKYYC